MLIQLPAETWIEILDWLKRRDLINKLDKLWDREFTPIVQDWLHKYTKNVKLGRLCASNDGYLYDDYWKQVPFAEVDLPENITSFERINLSYVDSIVLAFLRQLRPLFHNICLVIDDGFIDDLPTHAVRFLMPMINSNSIESISLDRKMLQFFLANYQSSLSNAKLLQIWDHFNTDINNEWLANWLFTPREDGQSRTLLLSNCEDSAGFWEKLRERFLDPARHLASPFFIQMRINLPYPSVICNVRTGEQFTVNGFFPFKTISNCPVNVDPKWLAKKQKEVRKWNFHDQQHAIWLGSRRDDQQQNRAGQKQMLIQLPAETWVEILDWLRRRDLIKKLDKLWDREFTPFVQDWLHKYTRNIKIGKLRATDDGLIARSCEYEQWEYVPFANVEMPGNITSFERIAVSYMDSTVLAFLPRMCPLFHTINLKTDYFANELLIQTALHFLMPMFDNDSIESLSFDYKLLQFFSTNYASALLTAKLLQIWDYFIMNASSEWLINWLFTRREDGQPRKLVIFHCGNTADFWEKIRERFIHASRPCACSPFFVRVWNGQSPIPDNIENVRTGEKLTFRTMDHDEERYDLITNCPKNTKLEWLDEKTEEMLEWDLLSNEQQVIKLTSLEISPQLYPAEDDAEQQQRTEAHLMRL